jgi:hypothetical protein
MILRNIRRRILAGKILKQAMKDEHIIPEKILPGLSILPFDLIDKKFDRIKEIAKSPDIKKVLSVHSKTEFDIYDQCCPVRS